MDPVGSNFYLYIYTYDNIIYIYNYTYIIIECIIYIYIYIYQEGWDMFMLRRNATSFSRQVPRRQVTLTPNA